MRAITTIEIRIRTLAQLVDALDPAPLPERTLNRNAESYIIASAGKHTATESLRLLVHLPESQRAQAADPIHEHFRRTHAQGEGTGGVIRRHRRPTDATQGPDPVIDDLVACIRDACIPERKGMW